jgi:hypothetical protein
VQDANQTKDRVVLIIILLAFVTLMTLISYLAYLLISGILTGIGHRSSAVAEDDRGPLGPDLAVPLSGTDSDVIVARLTLPDVPSNRHWFADWVMIIDKKDRRRTVQIGLMRRPEFDHRLRVYIGYSAPGQRWHYQDFRIAEGPHSVAITRDGDRFSFQIDGELQQTRAVLGMDLPYAQVGAQISNRADAISGVVAQLLAGPHGGLMPVELLDICRYDNHGLTFVNRNGDIVATGAYGPGLATGYHGNCSTLQQRSPKEPLKR